MSVGEVIAPFFGRLILAWFFLSEAWRYSRDWAGTADLLARKHVPHLIVLDIEHLAAGPAEIADDFAAQSRARATPLLLLGGRGRRSDVLPPAEFVRKPYHYGPLIRKIEELLAIYQQSVARAA